LSHGGKWLASSGGTDVRVWDLETRREIFRSADLAGPVWDVEFSPDGKHLAAATGGNADLKLPSALTVWNLETGAEEFSRTGTRRPDVASRVAFSPDGSQVACTWGGLMSAGLPYKVALYDAATGQDVLTLDGGKGWVTQLGFSRDGRWLLSLTSDEVLHVWDAGPSVP
jgi:WD40 repeat protein